MVDTVTGAPIGAQEPPSVTFGGIRYTMQVGTLCAYELSLMNVEPTEIFLASDRDRKVTSLAHILRLFRATIAHNFVQKHQPVPSPEELALMLDGEPREVFSEISEKTLNIIFPKLAALAKTVKLQETAPMPELPN